MAIGPGNVLGSRSSNCGNHFDMKTTERIQKFTTAGGIAVYLLPVQAFPHHVTNCYVVLDDTITLLDTGSGFGNSNESLVRGFDRLRTEFGERVRLEDIDRVILTHGHIDHFGGLNFVVEQSGAAVGIHELDANVIRHFHDQLTLSSKNLHLFLDRAGLPEQVVDDLVEMNKWSKDYFHASDVDFTFSNGTLEGGFRVFHTPGHCPGQVCLQLEDILFTADHVLSHITPNQSPESITRYTGLGHYLDSLDKIRHEATASVGLGGHEDPIRDVNARVADIAAFHHVRLGKLLELCDSPKSVAQLSQELFGPRKHYHILLALLETGAHLEYLFERAHVVVANMDDVELQYNPVLLYQRA
jgi:glyoxylase-like metal-dependent hydrolase (beta-lactamase superfamily II)